MPKKAGLRFRKADILFFFLGMISALALVFLIYGILGKDVLGGAGFFSLLANGRKKLLSYFVVGALEELVFRGVVFGIILSKIKNIHGRILIASLIFMLPHLLNTDNVNIAVMALFPFLYGIAACEMFCLTESIWLSTGFHWIWNWAVTSVFWTTGTQHLIYVWIIAEMLLLIPLLFWLIRKTAQQVNE